MSGSEVYGTALYFRRRYWWRFTWWWRAAGFVLGLLALPLVLAIAWGMSRHAR